MTTDPFTPQQRSAVMRAVPGKNSSAELKVRKALTQLGARYRLHRRDLPGSPDIVLPGRRLAIFVHGCFWHGHACRRGARPPKANAAYWTGKIARNMARDVVAQAALKAAGWRVEVVWECELRDAEVLGGRLAGMLGRLAASARLQTGAPIQAPEPPETNLRATKGVLGVRSEEDEVKR
jgi:DNA mismatch endonuclease (patch repair protein)